MSRGTTPWLPALVEDYIQALHDGIDAVLVDGLAEPAQVMARSVSDSGATIYALGNGGSSATAECFRAHLREQVEGHAARTFTGWTSHQIVEAVEQHGFAASTVALLSRESLGANDVVVLISASGNSRNLIAVADECRHHGVPVIACTGTPGGTLAERELSHLRVRSDDQQLSEDISHAALNLLTHATNRLVHGLKLDDTVLAERATWIKGNVWLDVDWIDRVSDALADAVLSATPIFVTAPEGGTLAVSVEHVAHNLLWDMCHDLDAAAPDVRSGISVAHYTGMSNDTVEPGAAICSMVEHAGAGDVMLVFGHDSGSPSVANLIHRSRTAGMRLFGVFAEHTGAIGQGDDVMIGRADPYLSTLRAQISGHLLLRAARPKITRRCRRFIDLAAEEQQARESVAPLRKRLATTSGPA